MTSEPMCHSDMTTTSSLESKKEMSGKYSKSNGSLKRKNFLRILYNGTDPSLHSG